MLYAVYAVPIFSLPDTCFGEGGGWRVGKVGRTIHRLALGTKNKCQGKKERKRSRIFFFLFFFASHDLPWLDFLNFVALRVASTARVAGALYHF